MTELRLRVERNQKVDLWSAVMLNLFPPAAVSEISVFRCDGRVELGVISTTMDITESQRSNLEEHRL